MTETEKKRKEKVSLIQVRTLYMELMLAVTAPVR